MPWARGGDTSATYPRALSVAGCRGADERSVNEIFGFFFRLSTQSAAHLTDYVVDAGTVDMIGGSNCAELVKFATRVGLLTKVRVDGMLAYKLIDDPEFIHIRLKSEVEWERQQRADTADLRITIPVRARDGDLCRYCAVPVVWRGRTSTRKATLDHLVPGEPATVATMVVACKGCNSELRDLAGEERADLLPVPDPAFYTPHTAAWLSKQGCPTRPTVVEEDDQRPGSQPDDATADSDPASGSRAAHGTTTSPARRPARQADHAATTHPGNARSKSPPSEFPVAAGMNSAGSGRVGSGNASRSSSTSSPAGRTRKRSARGNGARTDRTS